VIRFAPQQQKKVNPEASGPPLHPDCSFVSFFGKKATKTYFGTKNQNFCLKFGNSLRSNSPNFLTTKILIFLTEIFDQIITQNGIKELPFL
jgi:hypothetical protein